MTATLTSEVTVTEVPGGVSLHLSGPQSGGPTVTINAPDTETALAALEAMGYVITPDEEPQP